MPLGGWDEAEAALAAGALVGLPTDTVYGLVGRLAPGVAGRLAAAKGRPATIPFQALVADAAQAAELAATPPDAAALMAAFWPGGLTIVLPPAPATPPAGRPDLGGEGDGVGVRCPAGAELRRLCLALGPLAATSANRHGDPPCATAEEVASVFGAELAVVVDGGRLDGAASTVVDARGPSVSLRREGATPWEAVRAALSAARPDRRGAGGPGARTPPRS